MVGKIRVHVRVVDAVVEARVSHGHDDTASVKSGPTGRCCSHVGGGGDAGDVHDVACFVVEVHKPRARLNPFKGRLVCERTQSFAGEQEISEPPAVAEDLHATWQGFREVLAREHRAGQHGLVLCVQRFKEPFSDPVRGREPLHAGDAQGVELVRHEAVDLTMEGSRWEEGSTLDAGLGKFTLPRGWHRPRGAKDKPTVQGTLLSGP